MRKNVSVCAVLMLCQAIAKGSPSDVDVFLPLLARNSIARKVLDVTYSMRYEWNYNGEKESGKKDVHLLFDGETERFSEISRTDSHPEDKAGSTVFVSKWNGKEYSLWEGFAPNVSAPHDSGVAIVQGAPDIKIPDFVKILRVPSSSAL